MSRGPHTWSASTAPLVLAGALLVACSGGSSSAPPGADDAGAPSPDASTADGDAALDPGPATPDASAATSAPVCPLPERLGSPRCEVCIQAACCDVIRACADDAACRKVLSCSQSCLLDSAAESAGPCIDACKRDTPAGAAGYTAFDDCVAAPPPTGCAYECS